MHHGEVIVEVIQTLKGNAQQGWFDPRVQLVEQAGQIERRVDTRQRLENWAGDQMIVGPFFRVSRYLI